MSAGSYDVLSVARELEGIGIERGQAQAIAKAVQPAGEAGRGGSVKRADLNSVVAALRFPPV